MHTPSTKPLPQRMFMKPGQRIAVLHAPEGYDERLAELPEGVERDDGLTGEYDLVQIFVVTAAELAERAPVAKAALKPGGWLWVGYPKAKQMDTDLNRDIVAAWMAERGLKAVHNISVDDVWSALRFKIVENG